MKPEVSSSFMEDFSNIWEMLLQKASKSLENESTILELSC
jgi:hypothetical protein